MINVEENKKNILLKGLTVAYILQIITVVLGFVVQPMVLKYYGQPLFGIWSVILTILSYMGLFNIGVPAISMLLIAKTDNKIEKIKIFINATLILTIVSIIGIIVFYLLIIKFNGSRFLLGDIPLGMEKTIQLVFGLSVILFFIRFPLQVSQSAFAGFKKIHLQKFYEGLVQPVYFLILIIAVLLKLDIWGLAVVYGISQLAVNLLSSLDFVLKYCLRLGISFYRLVDIRCVREIMRGSVPFFLIGIPSLIILNTDSLVISHALGISEVSRYVFNTKLLQFPLQFINTILSVFFPMYMKAYVDGNYKWLQKIYDLLTSILPTISGGIWLAVVFWGRKIITLWTDDSSIYISESFMFIWGAYVYILTLVNISYTFIAGLNESKKVLFVAFLEAISHVIFTIVGIRIWGLSGLAVGVLLASFLFPFFILPFKVRNVTKNNVALKYFFNLKQCIIVIIPLIILFYMLGKPLVFALVLMFFYVAISILLIPVENRLFLLEMIKEYASKVKLKLFNN